MYVPMYLLSLLQYFSLSLSAMYLPPLKDGLLCHEREVGTKSGQSRLLEKISPSEQGPRDILHRQMYANTHTPRVYVPILLRTVEIAFL